jgi:uncharacterized protein YndB with AHSA1/START domain
MTAIGASLEVSRFIRAAPQRVYDAWTDPSMIVQWWGAGGITCPEAEVDLSVGGSYRIANRAPNGHTMWIAGTFTQVDPPRALSYTWDMEPIETSEPSSVVEVRFDPKADGTTVTINHRQIPSPEAREIHLEGWIGCMAGLDSLLTASG